MSSSGWGYLKAKKRGEELDNIEMHAIDY